MLATSLSEFGQQVDELQGGAMTMYSCSLGFQSDRSLKSKVTKGWYEGDVPGFPAPPSGSNWIGLLWRWAKERGIAVDLSNPLAVSARVKKDQIVDFIEYVYGKDPSYCDPARMLTW